MESLGISNLQTQRVFPAIGLGSLSNLSDVFSPLFMRVLFVRHPFERLASVYTEKIATVSRSQQLYAHLRQQICFNASKTSKRCQRRIPSFEHFLQYILRDIEDPTKMDPHWQPYSLLSHPCEFNYNFIGKFETIDEDLPYLLKRLGLSDWNSRAQSGATGKSTRHYQQLFTVLSDERICQLKRLYANDFRLFNYHFNDYVDRPSLTCNDI